MIETMTPTEIFALFCGLYCVAAGTGLVSDWKSYKTVMEELEGYSLTGFLTGLITFIIGAVIITFHNIWSNPIAIIVTLFGWGALIEGFLILAFRRRFVRVIKGIPLNAKTMVSYGVFSILLGLFLIFGAVG